MGEREQIDEQIKLLEWTLTLREAPHLRKDLGIRRVGKAMSMAIQVQIQAKIHELKTRRGDFG